MRIFDPPDEGFFDEQRERQLDALFEAILPGDAASPGASEVRAGRYLSLLLAIEEPSYYELQDWQVLYSQALPALDEASGALYAGRAVAELTLDETTELLRRLSQGTLEPMPAELDQKRLFATLRGHCIEGCFCDPRWGGNADGQMWRWFGYTADAEDLDRSSQPQGGVGAGGR